MQGPVRKVALSSHVAKMPAEIALHQGKQRVVAGSKGYPVHVGPRLGTVTGVEVLWHTLGSCNPGKEQQENVIL